MFRMCNCIIVSREHYVIDKKYISRINVNAIDTGMKLRVYTWFPYQGSDRCTEVNDITLLDSWVISAQGHFTKNIEFFPGKVSNNLNSCPMKAIVKNGESDFTTIYNTHMDSNGSVVTEVSGIEIDLLKLVLKQMNMTFIHVPTKENEFNLIRALFENKISIALGDLVNAIWLNTYFDCSSLYYVSGIRWYVPCSIKYPRWNSIFRILSVEMWLVLIISIVIAAISITLVGRYSCTSEWQRYNTLTSSLTNVWAVILGVAVSMTPRTASLRSMFLAWVCFSLVFSTVFQAFLTTFLIDSGYKTPIQNKDELFASGIKLSYPPGYSFIFENGNETEVSKVLRNRVDCLSFEVCLKWAVYQKNVSTILSDLYVEIYYANGALVGDNSEPLLCKV